MDSIPCALYSAVVEDVGSLLDKSLMSLDNAPPDLSYRQFCAFQLVKSILKKWIPKDSREADIASWNSFLAANSGCKDWCLPPVMDWESELLGEFRREVYDFFHPDGNVLISSYFDIFSKSRSGPGAAIGVKFKSFYSKLFSSKGAVTSTALYTLYKSYIRWFPEWADADAIRYEHFGYPRVTSCSRSSFVPKTSTKSRMICVEPSLNVFIQLGLADLLNRRLYTAFNTSMEDQPVSNRLLAKSGSINGDFATIDLQSASDSVSVRMLEWALPRYIFDILMDLRCSNTTYRGQTYPLYMISTMGNGFTFPLQTILFSCMIRAAYRVSGVPIKDRQSRNWGCFGDDLICHRMAVRPLLRLLQLLGFTVNDSKSFFEGPFRESCGADWFNGQYCRGVYIKSLSSKQDFLSSINLLNEWSARTGIRLNKTISFLLSQLKGFIPLVPFCEANDAGLRVPSTFLERSSVRYDKNLTVMYRRFESVPKRIFFGEGVIRYPRGVSRNLIYNPAGLLISFLLGEVVSCSISIRHDRVRYRSKLAKVPFWDFNGNTRPSDGIGLEWRRWETAVLDNIQQPL